ncbi:MAG: hypothetical protein HC802_09155 [Caldilineaceae bacterium]|nr:hypothetical protein [Caldilineaceae bacterium]
MACQAQATCSLVRRAAVTFILVFSTISTVYDYFGVFGNSEEVYYMYDADKLDALDYLQDFRAGADGPVQIYLSQLWADRHATVHLLRKGMAIKALDTSDTIVLPPPDQGAIYAFPSEQIDRARRTAQIWPDVEAEPVLDRFGQTLLSNVVLSAPLAEEWPADYRPEQTRVAHFSEAPTLLGMSADEQNGDIWLFWRGDSPMPRDLTSFVHLLDIDNRRIGQTDKLPGNGSYPTTDWTPGERVIDRYQPWLDDLCAGGEQVRVQVGWYEYAEENARRPRADGPGDSALAGYMTLPLASYPRERFYPSKPMETALDPELWMMGHDLYADGFQAGSPLLVDLYLLSQLNADSPTDRRLALRVANADGEYLLWEGEIAPDARWEEGEAICRRLRLRLPAAIEPGTYRLEVLPIDREGDPLLLEEIVVGDSTRRFDLPEVLFPINATLVDATDGSGQVSLVGVESIDHGASEDQFVVTLVWHARATPQNSYKVFVHLTDENGQIVAQSDAIPGQGYASNRWISGEVVTDAHVLTVPPGTPPGAYSLLAGMYDPISGRRLDAFDTNASEIADGAIPLGRLTWPME